MFDNTQPQLLASPDCCVRPADAVNTLPSLGDFWGQVKIAYLKVTLGHHAIFRTQTGTKAHLNLNQDKIFCLTFIESTTFNQ